MESPTSRLFQLRAAGCTTESPASVLVDTPAAVALARMREGGCDSVLVLDRRGRLSGVLSARDIASADPTAAACTLTAPSPPVAAAEEPLCLALARMRKHRLSSLPVVDATNRSLGLLTQDTLLDLLTAGLPVQLERLAEDEQTNHLLAARNRQAELAATLRHLLHVPPAETLAALASLNDRVYQRVVGDCVSAMEQQGWGSPPVAFAVIVMGSLARRECMLNPDQDNGFVLADYPDEQLLTVDGYFQELAARMTNRLHEVGFQLCTGYVMATNPSWRKRLTEWKTQFGGWLKRPSHASTMLTDICVDFRCLYGDSALVDALRGYTDEQFPRHHGFLQELERLQFERDVAVTPFRTLKRERLPGAEGDGQLDAKRKGIMPLVEGIRLLALKTGISAGSTSERLASLVSNKSLSAELAAELDEAFATLTGLLLDQQIKDHRDGRTPNAYLPPDTLSAGDRKRLRAALMTATRLRGKVHSDMTGELT